jgi:hypothetical protein
MANEPDIIIKTKKRDMLIDVAIPADRNTTQENQK